MERDRLVIKPWWLPLLVLAIALPITAGFLLGGPGIGVAVGALVGVAMLVVVARMRPQEQIEVARAEDSRRRLLVTALAAIEEPETAAEVIEAAGVRPGTVGAGAVEILVLAPASNTPLAHWASDVREAREAAQRRLTLSLATLAAARLEARGQVGDTDPVQAVEDTLRVFPADAAVLVVPPVEGEGEAARTLATLRSRLDLPLRLVEAQPSEPQRG